MFYIRSIVFLCAVCFVQGCDNSLNETLTPQKLEGKWIMGVAARDNKLTETLKGSYFIFDGSGVLINNINRREQSFNYSIVENTIQQRGNLHVDYIVKKFENDTLVLKAEIKDYDFQFLLVRDTSEVHFQSIGTKE